MGAAPVVVVSALAGVTDALVAAAQFAEDGQADRAAAAAWALRSATPPSPGFPRRQPCAPARRGAAGVLELAGRVHALAVLRGGRRAARRGARRRRTGEQPDRPPRSPRSGSRAGRRAHRADHRRPAQRRRADMAGTCERQAIVRPPITVGRWPPGRFTGATAPASPPRSAAAGRTICRDLRRPSGTDKPDPPTSTACRPPTRVVRAAARQPQCRCGSVGAGPPGAKVLHPSMIPPAVKEHPGADPQSRRPDNAGTRITADAMPCRPPDCDRVQARRDRHRHH